MRGKWMPADTSVRENRKRVPPAVSLPANSKYTEKGTFVGKITRLVSEASCLLTTLVVPKPVVWDLVGSKNACRMSQADCPPAAPPPKMSTRLAANDQPEFAGSMPRRRPLNFG